MRKCMCFKKQVHIQDFGDNLIMPVSLIQTFK